MAVLPPESLSDWLRRMFGLAPKAARFYEEKIYKAYPKKPFAKVRLVMDWNDLS